MSQVEAKDQLAAFLIWMLAILAFCAYAATVFATRFELRKTPTQSVTYKDDGSVGGETAEQLSFPNVVS